MLFHNLFGTWMIKHGTKELLMYIHLCQIWTNSDRVRGHISRFEGMSQVYGPVTQNVKNIVRFNKTFEHACRMIVNAVG